MPLFLKQYAIVSDVLSIVFNFSKSRLGGGGACKRKPVIHKTQNLGLQRIMVQAT